MLIYAELFVILSLFFFFKQKTAYEMRISDWSSDVCSSDFLEMDRYGIDPEHFEDMCSNERITALVCTPNLNNPTTSLMPDTRRREIAEIARRFEIGRASCRERVCQDV